MLTGANGFLGKCLCETLKKNNFIVIKFDCDIRKIKSFPTGHFDFIIHLASLITHRDKYSLEELEDVNVRGTQNLISCYPSTKIIYSSTKDVYRKTLSDYAKSKVEAERYIKNNPNNLIVRIPSLFGLNQKQKSKLIPRLFDKYVYNQNFELRNNELREYIYVEEVSKFFVDKLSLTGTVDMNGYKILNSRVDAIISSICKDKEIVLKDEDERRIHHYLNIMYNEIIKNDAK